ncbi:MAG TPA: DinB family protein [Candidatus Dormibacteraeota bacterium]|nr:DinB family protein [Candidatus Dormibacteraeota bacterium]
MDELLLEAFRHNSWATRRLLEFCGTIPQDQLNASAPGTFGSIISTFNHVIYAHAGYLPRARITRPAWAEGDEVDVTDLKELQDRVDETELLWERYLADPLDARFKLTLDQGAYEAESFVPIVQALHHGDVHREQICSVLTSLGIEPPDLQVWAYAEATGHAREVH